NDIRIELDPTDPTLLRVSGTGLAAPLVVQLATVQRIAVKGLGGNDRLTVDTRVRVPDGITFDGGAGSNRLIVSGVTGDAIAHRRNAGGDGLVAVSRTSGTQSVVFFGVTGLQLPGARAGVLEQTFAGLKALGFVPAAALVPRIPVLGDTIQRALRNDPQKRLPRTDQVVVGEVGEENEGGGGGIFEGGELFTRLFQEGPGRVPIGG